MKVNIGLLARNDVSNAMKKLFAAKMSLDGTGTWKLIKFRKALGEEGDLINKAIQEVDGLFVVEEDGNRLIPQEKIVEWQAKRVELFNQEVELPDFSVKLEDFDYKAFSADDLAALVFVGVLVEKPVE
jgi:hypothetical protein